MGTKSMLYWPGTVDTMADNGPDVMVVAVSVLEVLRLGGVAGTSGKNWNSGDAGVKR